MLKLSKKADYALIAVRHLATHRGEPSESASDIAEAYGISAPLLAKVLQRLARHGLVTARHGSSGGYQLARHPKEISALDVINASSGRSNSSENLIPQRVITRAFPRTFRLALLEKDIGIAAMMADDLKVRTPLISLTAERFHEARELLGEEADHVEAVKMVERENGVEIR